MVICSTNKEGVDYMFKSMFSKKEVSQYKELKYQNGEINLKKHNDKIIALKLIQLGEKDLGILKSFQEEIKVCLPKIVKSFYSELMKIKELDEIIKKHSTVERLSVTIENHIYTIFEGVINDAYMDRRIMVAKNHVRIHLQTKWYIIAFRILQQKIEDELYEHNYSPEYTRNLLSALVKIINLEQQLVLTAYEEESVRQREDEIKKWENSLNEASGKMEHLSNQTKDTYEDLSLGTYRLFDATSLMREDAKNAYEEAVEGKSEIDKLVGDLNRVKVGLTLSANDISELDDVADKMNDILNIIRGVADQTNMLSLNASIEAARAGEAGKGFAVVAQEIQKLAKQTKQSVSHVAEHINRLVNQIAKIESSLNALEKDVKCGESQMAETICKFDNISRAVSEINQQYELVSNETTNMKEALKKVKESIDGTNDAAEAVSMLMK